MNSVLEVQQCATYSDLYLAIELSASNWQLAFSNGTQQRNTAIEIGDWMGLQAEIKIAKKRLRCTEDCQVHSCYEAKRQGYWFHRALLAKGINNLVLGPSIKQVNRKKQAMIVETDVEVILRQLMRLVSKDSF